MIKLLLIMLGGSLGALCRYGIAVLAARWIGIGFPWGTLLANLTGCFLIGAAFALADRNDLLNPMGRLFFMTGFLGSLTTFSTFALETVTASRSNANTLAIANLLLNNFGAVLCVLLGMGLTQWVLAKG
jgi:CrcB protein